MAADKTKITTANAVISTWGWWQATYISFIRPTPPEIGQERMQPVMFLLCCSVRCGACACRIQGGTQLWQTPEMNVPLFQLFIEQHHKNLMFRQSTGSDGGKTIDTARRKVTQVHVAISFYPTTTIKLNPATPPKLHPPFPSKLSPNKVQGIGICTWSSVVPIISFNFWC